MTFRLASPRIAAALLTSFVALTGCAGSAGPFGGGGYTVAADDTCAAQRQALKAYQDYFFSSMIQGAAIGAVGGGLMGLAIGGNAQSAAIGAGVGALAGGATGYFAAKQKANNDPVALTSSVYDDVNRENGQIDGVSAAFRAVRTCRLQAADAVKADYAAKRTTREDAQAKLQRIKQLFLEDVQFAQGLGSKMAERGTEYQTASDKIVQMNPGAQQQAQQRQAPSAAPSGAGMLEANEAVRVREQGDANARQIATLSPGERVSVVAGAAPADWTHVQLPDGKTGYVASRLLRPAGTAAPAARPPVDAAGVAQLTESNQLKRKGLDDQVAAAKDDANGSAFELSGSISRVPPALVPLGAA
ncbi:MAG TPA: SH3 domain-containing protein [Stellaceae bacterium]|nr:SH3 domain-containing protein [Stellaceae bacterium]